MTHLTPRDCDLYDQQGFLIVEKLLDDQEVARLGERLRLAALGELDPGVCIGKERDLPDEVPSDEDPLLRVRKVWDLARHEEYFRRLVSSDRLVNIARDLLGDEIR